MDENDQIKRGVGDLGRMRRRSAWRKTDKVIHERGTEESREQEEQEKRFGYTFLSVDWIAISSTPKRSQVKPRHMQ